MARMAMHQVGSKQDDSTRRDGRLPETTSILHKYITFSLRIDPFHNGALELDALVPSTSHRRRIESSVEVGRLGCEQGSKGSRNLVQGEQSS